MEGGPAPTRGEALRVVVRGRVQGVGFRYFVIREAASRGITGYVRNLPEESGVEVIACGDAASLDGLVKQLRTGPPAAHVSEIDVQPVASNPNCAGFGIRY